MYTVTQGRRHTNTSSFLICRFNEEGDEELVNQVLDSPAFFGGASVFTKMASEEALCGHSSGTWLLRKDHGKLCLSWIYEGRVSHHFITHAGSQLKISLFPFANEDVVVEGTTVVDDMLAALHVAQDFWPVALDSFYVKANDVAVDVVRTREAAKVIKLESAVVHKTRAAERHSREADAAQPLAFTKGARKQRTGDGKGSDERLVGHTAVEHGSGSAASTSRAPASGVSGTGKSTAASPTAPMVPTYHRHGKFFHANCNKTQADELLFADDGKALKKDGKNGV